MNLLDTITYSNKCTVERELEEKVEKLPYYVSIVSENDEITLSYKKEWISRSIVYFENLLVSNKISSNSLKVKAIKCVNLLKAEQYNLDVSTREDAHSKFKEIALKLNKRAQSAVSS